jgi:hypothetical protein
MFHLVLFGVVLSSVCRTPNVSVLSIAKYENGGIILIKKAESPAGSAGHYLYQIECMCVLVTPIANGLADRVSSY